MAPPESSLLPAHFVGVLLSTIFYGLTLTQAFAYYRTYSVDPRHMRLIVAFLLLLDTAQVALASASIYEYAIRLRGDEDALRYVSTPFIVSMAVTSAVAFTVQMIYAYRIYRLSAGNAYLTTAIIALACVALGSSTGMIAKMTHTPRWDSTRVTHVSAALLLATLPSCDLLIAGAQVWLIHRDRLKLKFKFMRGSGFVGKAFGGAVSVDGRAGYEGEAPGEESRRADVSSLRAPSASPGTESIGTKHDSEHDGGCEDEEHDGCRLGALLTTLTLLVVNVGLLTSVDAVLFLVLFLICPDNGTFLVPYILLSNCYVNSFLSILNSRRILRELIENPEHFPGTFDFALDIAAAGGIVRDIDAG